jgi:hypothetical protein
MRQPARSLSRVAAILDLACRDSGGTMNALPGARTVARFFPAGRLAARGFIAIFFLAAAGAPGAAQSGARKPSREKNAASAPDSAAVADSLAKLQADTNGVVAGGEVAPAEPVKKKSFLRRAASSAVKASDKFEDVTGVSVKDAAMAASGAGVAGIAAKKLGVDPSSVVGNAVGNAVGKAVSGAAGEKGVQGAAEGAVQGAVQGAAQGAIPGMAGMPGTAGMPNAATIQAMQAMQGAAAANAGQAAMMPGSADTQTMLQFQQEMMQVTMAATTGDAIARAKLDAWQKMSEKFEGEATKLNVAIAGGDATAYVKLQQMQTRMMREWLEKYAAKSPAVKP